MGMGGKQVVPVLAGAKYGFGLSGSIGKQEGKVPTNVPSLEARPLLVRPISPANLASIRLPLSYIPTMPPTAFAPFPPMVPST